MKKSMIIGCCLVLLGACNSTIPFDPVIGTSSFQTMSLLGDSLYIPPKSTSAQERLQLNLDEAISNFVEEQSEINFIWLGRRWAYLGDYRKAIEVYSQGLEKYPSSYKLLRHRGHRYVSLREFEKAISDFKKAHELMPKGEIEVEPDGIPNSINQPLSNTQFNILYHWGLAEYLKGNYGEAERIYLECMDYSKNDDLITATTDWLYMTQRRMGNEAKAMETLSTHINDSMNIVENESYHKRLRMYSGQLPIDSLFDTNDADAQLSLITQGYGVANWYLYNGDTLQAEEILTSILDNSSWSPFGYIAAESDYRMLKKD
jgi:tetratricopeptide (TPR) repeat protein